MRGEKGLGRTLSFKKKVMATFFPNLGKVQESQQKRKPHPETSQLNCWKLKIGNLESSKIKMTHDIGG